MRNLSEINGKNSEIFGKISEINFTLVRVRIIYSKYTVRYILRYSISKRKTGLHFVVENLKLGGVSQVRSEDDEIIYREWFVTHRIRLMKTYQEYIFIGKDKKKYRRLFSHELHKLFDETDIEGESKWEYLMVIMSYLQGRTLEINVLDIFDHYIYD